MDTTPHSARRRWVQVRTPGQHAGPVLLVTGDGFLGHWGRFSWSLGTVLLVTGDGFLGHWGRFSWSLGTVFLVTGDGFLGHWGRFSWSLGTVFLVTGDGSLGHRGRFSWSLGTVLLVTGDGFLGHWGRFSWSPGTVLLVTGPSPFTVRGTFLSRSTRGPTHGTRRCRDRSPMVTNPVRFRVVTRNSSASPLSDGHVEIATASGCTSEPAVHHPGRRGSCRHGPR